ncbi:MAG: type II secretion system protein [Candidatus Pacebacteria bacterium]|jgi:prepilin-type N-terminal cleavage/methylation domain-containing protein|nr:type II secretion system protein [Candidatus Paceibacterota bacterium]MDD3072782.1 type II secretion system protein [Candidatus Paceibacterota bacterium]MDD3729310.1 type II secretion system protein [Candidatus Paceibacterota bacterium]MDD4201822.1 type II secretion system protein [Candidatus Paceibacterota bacterium]MDD4467013.1 type II secretion system protein [Candidatus Paceibacterota bacterium]
MRKGFSLIEMLVVSAVLAAVSVGAIASFSSIIKAQRYALRAQHLLDQGGYSIDYIGNALRMAKRETGVADCINYGKNYEYHPKGIKFISFDGTFKCRKFYLSSGVLIDYEEGRTPEEIPLTSSDVEITDFGVIIEDNVGIQPLVYLILKMKPSDFDSPLLEFSTVISQRDLNVPLE